MELVRRGLASDIDEARALISALRIVVNGACAVNVARLVSPGEAISVLDLPPKFVGRGGLKLEAALEHFQIDVAAKRVLDAGSSTGGFVDCVCQRGAAAVAAVDVGRGQLHSRVRGDSRVRVYEGVNVRSITLGDVGGVPFDVVTADLSFISLAKVVGALISVAAPGADLVLLVKPQFECTRREASIGRGVVSDPAVWLRALEDIALALSGAGAVLRASMVSPVRGADGNTEFFVHATVGKARQGALLTERARKEFPAVVAAAGSRARDRGPQAGCTL